ncbi:MAG: helix-turn-helix transcriptional regulator [Turicibacter sp.]|nr:helix-turn-helix transcriptional regulator [Turicibacter sp.]
MARTLDKDFHCRKELTLALIGGKWKMLILWRLGKEGTKRFNELKESVAGVTQKILTKQLRDLEDDHLVHRKIYPEVPPRVEYSLTERGQSLIPVLEAMYHWGTDYCKEFDTEGKIPLG